jgi:8-amino-7-oxononanoate synthase
LGSSGAYICGDAVLCEYLVNRARSFIFSTAPPPHCAAASRAAVELLDSIEGERLVQKLHHNTALLGANLSLPAPSAIFPIILGDGELAVEASRKLLEAGFLVPAIRYPTVARGSERLRVTATAAHQIDAIERLGSHLSELRGGLQETEIGKPGFERS